MNWFSSDKIPKKTFFIMAEKERERGATESEGYAGLSSMTRMENFISSMSHSVLGGRFTI